MKIKVVEYGANKSIEGIYMPNVVNILESEPLISVSKRKLKILTFGYNNRQMILVGRDISYDSNTSFESTAGTDGSQNGKQVVRQRADRIQRARCNRF